MREQGFFNTGTRLSVEMRSNLFMVAYLEAIVNINKTPFCDWVTNGFQPYDYENMEREYMSARQLAVAAITQLRESRTSYNAPIDQVAARIRGRQLGKHDPALQE